ncbi:MAG: MoxR family ATPase, partial [bacterium]|nr:MoxR family ATPase [bacterium]
MPETRSVQIDDITLQLGHAVASDQTWIGQTEVLYQLLACWLVVHAADRPLSPRLIGPPGIGKTTLAMAAAEKRNQPLYIYQCTSDTRPEDLLVTPVLAESGKIAYHASPLVTAMLTGGICILDEGNRMNEKSWASLAPLLDHRRYVESIVAGITIPAHADFRCCVTMNDDESTYEIPDYILSRLQPTLQIGFPNRLDEMAILRYHLPFVEDGMLTLTVDFLQRAHDLNLEFSPRDGIHILQYALKRLAQDHAHPLHKDQAWAESLACVLGE